MREKMKNWMKFIVVACSICILFAGAMPVQAAKKSSDNSAYQAVFDAEYYYNTYPDLQAAIGYNPQKLFQHFVTNGIAEGRSGCENFNLQIYKANYEDLRIAFGTNNAAYCRHYVTNGIAEGRNATSLLPGIQSSDANQVLTELASCTTYYSTAEARAINIGVAASRLNGTVLQPGDTFSYSKTVLPRTAANGYVTAPIYVSGKHGMGVGGGICQVSSTLYSAMLDAGIPATERHAHSLPVPYLPVGRDATIAGNYLDLKFKNTFDRPLVIQAVTDNGAVTVTISLD